MFTVSQFLMWEKPKPIDYSLLLTNLGDNAYGFQIRLHSVVSGQPYVQPLPWFKGSWDKGVHGHEGEFGFSQVGPSTFASNSLVPVPPNETVRIDLKLAIPWQASNLQTVAGYVVLSIPLVEHEPGNLNPQGEDPVPILVHPFRDYGGGKFQDIPSPISISSGKALNEIMPEQPQTWALPSWNAVEDIGRRHTAEVDDAFISGSDAAVFIEAPESLRNVLTYVAHLGQSTANIDRFNELLAEAGHDLRLTSD